VSKSSVVNLNKVSPVIKARNSFKISHYLDLKHDGSVTPSSDSSKRVSKSKTLSSKSSQSSKSKGTGSSASYVPTTPVNASFLKIEKKKLKRYQLLFLDFKRDNFLQNYYILFDYIRFVIFMVIIALCHSTPKSLFILILTLNSVYIVYIIAINPFRYVLIFIETLIVECLGDTYIVLMALYYFIADVSYDMDTKIKFGWLIIFCNLVLVLVICLFCLI